MPIGQRLAAIGGRTRSALLALGLAAAGAGAARAEDAARIEAPTSVGAKVELVAGTLDAAPAGIVLAMARQAPVAGNEGGIVAIIADNGEMDPMRKSPFRWDPYILNSRRIRVPAR